MITHAIYTFYNHFIHMVYLCIMLSEHHLPEPVLFNPLKHHLGFIREYILTRSDTDNNTGITTLIRELKHIGTSVMDIYTGSLMISQIGEEIIDYLSVNALLYSEKFASWTGRDIKDFKIITLSDGSQWTLKYHDNMLRWVHIFPSRGSVHTFRIKSNTLKSALLYYILIGKDYITGDDLNRVRPLLGLSPVKDAVDTRAITEMIEILRARII